MVDHPEQISTPNAQGVERSTEAMAGMTRRTMETMLVMAHGAMQGFEGVTTELAAFSRASFERTTHATQAMTAAASPNELMKMQADHSRQQFEAAMMQMAKISQVMIEATRDSLALATGTATSRDAQ